MKNMESSAFRKRNLSRILFWLPAILIFNVCYVSAENIDGKEYLRNGRRDLEAGNFAGAVKHLLTARKEIPILADYALLYLSEAYHKLGDHKRSLDALRSLLEKYPQSPLLRKARASEIRESRENPEENLLQLHEAYIKDYPDDEEGYLRYGFFLRQGGDAVKAAAVFKNLYLRAGVLSNPAYAELNPGDIKSADLVTRASNLIKRYEFKEAERDLRKALAMDDGKNSGEILKDLAYSLFKQKEYKEAARIYDRIHDAYFKARSLYRACDKQGFETALNELLSGNDKRAGYLLSTVASDKRRERDFEGALKIYNDVLDHYPSEAEEAMWGMGWTYYKGAQYKKASEIFAKLYSRYDDPKYLYWQARGLEALGEDAGDLYNSLIKLENNYYSALARTKKKTKISSPVSYGDPRSDIPAGRQDGFERIEILLSIDMRKEALMELICLTKKIDTAPGLIYVVSKFQELGEFKRSIGLVTGIPYSERLHRFWYPLAFWDDVNEISKRHGIDPLIALSVMREESRFDIDARSVAGARGLMQVMPQTAYRLDKGLGIGIKKETQINNVKNNINLGTYYLRALFNEFKSLPLALAAYNAGEVVVKKWEQQSDYKSIDEFIEDIPYAETRNYVKKVITSYYQYKRSATEDKTEADFGVILGRR